MQKMYSTLDPFLPDHQNNNYVPRECDVPAPLVSLIFIWRIIFMFVDGRCACRPTGRSPCRFLQKRCALLRNRPRGGSSACLHDSTMPERQHDSRQQEPPRHVRLPLPPPMRIAHRRCRRCQHRHQHAHEPHPCATSTPDGHHHRHSISISRPGMPAGFADFLFRSSTPRAPGQISPRHHQSGRRRRLPPADALARPIGHHHGGRPPSSVTFFLPSHVHMYAAEEKMKTPR